MRANIRLKINPRPKLNNMKRRRSRRREQMILEFVFLLLTSWFYLIIFICLFHFASCMPRCLLWFVQPVMLQNKRVKMVLKINPTDCLLVNLTRSDVCKIEIHPSATNCKMMKGEKLEVLIVLRLRTTVNMWGCWKLFT